MSVQQNEEVKALLTEASIEQNEEVKKISGWAAILFAPTLIAGVYGMNSTTCRSSTGSSSTPSRRS